MHKLDRGAAPASNFTASPVLLRARVPDANYDAVVIAASLGGLTPLRCLVAGLSPDFPAPILVVQHTDPRHPSYLPAVLAQDTSLTVVHAAHGAKVCPGTVLIAPSGRHLLVTSGGRCRLSEDPRVNYTRPAADLLFSSAARWFGERTLGVVLSGRLTDGTRGALDIRAAGGVVVAQDPATCDAPGMPRSAMAAGAVNFVLEPQHIAAALVSLVMLRGVPALFGVAPRSRSAA